MITFFTTPKPFTGKNKINQLNALRSWKQFSPECEIIVFDNIIGDDSFIKELVVINIVNLEKFSKEIPLPFVNDLFHKASQFARNPICCYLNADIILPENFLEIVIKIHKKLKSKYLLVGQRYDIDIDKELIFNKNWEIEFLNENRNKLTLHPPLGSDFFVFPKNQYIKNDIPRLVIGRPGWDNWFIYNGVKIKGIKVVDVSEATIVYHQNHNQIYNSFESLDRITISNLSFLPTEGQFDYVLGQTNYYINNKKIKKRNKNICILFIRRLMKGLIHLQNRIF